MWRNPHVLHVHVPAHVLGILAVFWGLNGPVWPLIGWFIAFNLWFSGFGISVGFHRYFTHRAFATRRAWQLFMLAGGTLAGQGSVVFWTALHRAHHPHSDTQADVHSPVHGLWNAYMGWIFNLNPEVINMRRAVDVARDPACRWTHKHYTSILWMWWTTLIAVGAVWPAARPAVAAALIAGMWAIHQEALINSVCHDKRFGVRAFDTNDSSRNVHALHWITWGQSLHNNHHAHAGRANFGTEKAPDVGYRIIQAIQVPAPTTPVQT